MGHPTLSIVRPESIPDESRSASAFSSSVTILELPVGCKIGRFQSGVEEAWIGLWWNRVNWKTEALTKDCLEAAHSLQEQPWLKSFYLAGGTALALWYGHRISVDLDFFSESNPLQFVERQTLIQGLKKIGAEIEEEKDGTVHALCGPTHLSFFKYSYSLFKPTKLWNSIPVADPLDIGLMKIGAIIGRGSKKDFYDLATILERDYSLKKLFRYSEKKFQGHRDFRFQAVRALIYFDDAEQEPAPKLIDGKSWEEIKIFFENEVRNIG